MENEPSPISEVLKELKSRGYKAKQMDDGVFFDVHPDNGVCFSYAVEIVDQKWQVNVTHLAFDETGEDNEEQYTLGDYRSATEVADAIDEDEERI
jgi:broad-specificity NMP kinase